MGLIAPVSRADEKRIAVFKKDVKQCAQELSYRLGYAENTADRYQKE
jgi:DNA-binding IclR family transcriptional regulator